MLLVGRRSCWYAIGSVGDPWFSCVHSLSAAHVCLFCAYGRRCHRNCSSRRRSRMRSTPGFSQLAAGGRLMRQDAWQQQAAQRLSSRSTALAQREEECRGWPNGHPGMRAGEAPLTRLACHAGYKGGGRQCGERRRVQPGWLASVSQILSAAVNQRNIAFPCDVQPVRHPTR